MSMTRNPNNALDYKDRPRQIYTYKVTSNRPRLDVAFQENNQPVRSDLNMPWQRTVSTFEPFVIASLTEDDECAPRLVQIHIELWKDGVMVDQHDSIGEDAVARIQMKPR